MSEQNQSVTADIAFLRSLAEAGGEGTMRGGAILTLCGVVFGGASLASAFATSHQPGPWTFPAIWLTAMVLFFIGLIPLKRGASKPGNTRQVAAGAAWSCIGMASFFIWLCFAVVAYRTGRGVVFAALGPVYLSLYAGAWLMCATLWRKRWMWLTAAAAACAALFTAWSVNHLPQFWLVYGVSLVVVLTLPGLYLMRQARA